MPPFPLSGGGFDPPIGSGAQADSALRASPLWGRHRLLSTATKTDPLGDTKTDPPGLWVK